MIKNKNKIKDTNKIIKYLDDYLMKNHIQFISAPEANQILEEAGLLNDSIQRPGKPLRKLLRAGYFPHAYKNNGRWVIPCSKDDNSKLHRQGKNDAVVDNNSRNLLPENINEIKKKLEEARTEFKPDK